MLTPEEITAVAYRALEDKKAKDVKILKTAEHTVLADYFVICNGSSSTHIKALVDEVDKQLSEAGAGRRGRQAAFRSRGAADPQGRPPFGHLGPDGLRQCDRPHLYR